VGYLEARLRARDDTQAMLADEIAQQPVNRAYNAAVPKAGRGHHHEFPPYEFAAPEIRGLK
jgi:hypothetical protein